MYNKLYLIKSLIVSRISMSLMALKLICNGNDDYKIIVITTYQSSDKLIKGIALTGFTTFNIPLCIFDEAHKTVGYMNKQFGLLLDDTNLKIQKRLFMTATPKIYYGNNDNENILSM